MQLRCMAQPCHAPLSNPRARHRDVNPSLPSSRIGEGSGVGRIRCYYQRMCLGIPGKVLTIYEKQGLRMGKLDFGGIEKEACLAYLPELELGDYAIVHVGFAITKLDEVQALESLRLFEEMGLLQEELGNYDGDEMPVIHTPKYDDA